MPTFFFKLLFFGKFIAVFTFLRFHLNVRNQVILQWIWPQIVFQQLNDERREEDMKVVEIEGGK